MSAPLWPTPDERRADTRSVVAITVLLMTFTLGVLAGCALSALP